jgi:hypothetical protein
MAQITLRVIDPQIERKIRLMARKNGKSLNRVVLDMIYQHIEAPISANGLNRIANSRLYPSSVSPA